MNPYEQGLGKTGANFVALSPTSFVERSAEVFGDLEAVVHGRRRYTWREPRRAIARLAPVVATPAMDDRLEIAEDLGAALDEAGRRERDEVRRGLVQPTLVDVHGQRSATADVTRRPSV